MASPVRRTRQYRVTHIPTGIVTVVQAPADMSYANVSAQVGARYPADATVTLVPEGQEVALPFDDCQLMLRPRVA